MKQIDFSQGSITKNIFQTAIPMLVAQVLNLLYNIVDRIYIGRIPTVGSLALGAVGLCFPVITILSAFANLYASGGGPIFAIERGRKELRHASRIMNTCFYLLIATAIVLTIFGQVFARPMLILFGASKNTLPYCLPYLRIYLFGTIFSMMTIGMNPFINAQGYPRAGMMTVLIGALANLILDPLFIFVFGMGVKGAAIATIISQFLSALFVFFFLRKKSIEIRLEICTVKDLYRVKDILSLGLSGFIMQLTNGLVQVSCNSVLSQYGGDLYISIMTIVSSVRQMLEIPIWALTDGASSIISYNYGAAQNKRVKKAFQVMFIMTLVYAGLVCLAIESVPAFFISIFSNDAQILSKGIAALHLYFFAFIFMVFQYCGQTMFKALNKRGYAIFFSLLRKAIIVIPLTYLLPSLFHFGSNGVFMAEPVSNIVGGTLCIVTMFMTIWKELV